MNVLKQMETDIMPQNYLKQRMSENSEGSGKCHKSENCEGSKKFQRDEKEQ